LAENVRHTGYTVGRDLHCLERAIVRRRFSLRYGLMNARSALQAWGLRIAERGSKRFGLGSRTGTKRLEPDLAPGGGGETSRLLRGE